MSVSDVSFQGGSALWFVPMVLGAGADAAKLNGVGEAVTVIALGDAEIERPVGAASAKTEYNSASLANGATIESAKRTVTVDGSGTVKTASGDAAVHKLTANVLENKINSLHKMISLENSANNGYVLSVVPLGDTNDAGFGYLLSKITGSIKKKLSGNAANPIALVFDGITETVQATATLTHTLINTAITSLTQPGTGVALHPTTAGATFALEAADMADLLAGKWVFKPTA